MRRLVQQIPVNCTRGGGSASLGLATEIWRLAGGQRPVLTHLPVPEALDFINEKPTHE